MKLKMTLLVLALAAVGSSAKLGVERIENYYAFYFHNVDQRRADAITTFSPDNGRGTAWIAATNTAFGVASRKEPLLSARLPCGNIALLYPGDRVPTNDVPCPCGNSNHWFWKFEK